MELINLNTHWGNLIIDELTQNGCALFCVSPGSRSTPLTVAAARHPQAKTIVCYDERGAAFFALGYARATRRPVPLICTSGTAAANYLPAVIEADIDNVPMIVLSADRPPELRHTMANQTIVQPPMFAPYTRWRVDLPAPTKEIAPEYVRTTIDQAVYRAVRAPQGVVHLNCMFREPLVEEAVSDEWLVVSKKEPYTAYGGNPAVPDLSSLVPIVEQAERGLLLVGQLRTEAEREAVLALGARLQWPLLPDITSGLRLGTADTPFIIHHFDQILLAPDDELPDVILHIGGQMVSKRLMQFVGRVRPKYYVVLNSSPERYDPLHTVTHRFEGDIPTTLPRFIPNLTHVIHNEAWFTRWRTQNRTVRIEIEARDRDGDIDEIDVARVVSGMIPAGSALFIGNSMPIRDMDMFGAADGERVRVAANRGASGIDGNLACGMGVGVGCERPTTIIVGDLTFIHDLNSLTLLRQIDSEQVPITIVVINNSGGGIFHNLPIAQVEDVFEPYFGTPHTFQFEDVARGFGIAYQRVATRPELQEAYGTAVSSTQSTHTIIEVTTDRVANTAAHKKLQGEIRDALLGTGR